MGISTIKDRVIQTIVKNALEPEWEAKFESSSYGFRPGRSTHDAIEDIWATTNKGKKLWVLDADIKGCFDNLSHNVILDILARDIKDNRFLKLIRTMLKAGYMEDWKYHETLSGAPQGGVVSPTLSNIVLNELDNFVENELIPNFHHCLERSRVLSGYPRSLEH